LDEHELPDMGNVTGAAVVLIHGYTDNARDWVPLLPYLSKGACA
jgi:pimeloyl-ACP methyl ester carboxylesterase